MKRILCKTQIGPPNAFLLAGQQIVVSQNQGLEGFVLIM
jgi:hypothetical protein